MVWIPLLTGGQAKVSDSKIHLALEKDWYQRSNGYVFSTTYPEVSLHQHLFGKAPEGFQWKFRDGDKLNNQTSNLELISTSELVKIRWKKKKSK